MKLNFAKTKFFPKNCAIDDPFAWFQTIRTSINFWCLGGSYHRKIFFYLKHYNSKMNFNLLIVKIERKWKKKKSELAIFAIRWS